MSENATKEKELVQPETIKTAEKKPFNKRIILVAWIILAVIYFGGAIYFNSHFFPATYINNVNCSFLTVEDAEKKIAETVKDYTYTIKSDKAKVIKGSTIGLVCNKIEGVDEAKAKQNPFMWVFDYENRDMKAEVEISYNEDALFHQMELLDCVVKSRETINAVPSKIAYASGNYSISESGEEKVFDFGALFSRARLDIYDLKDEISIEKAGLYIPVAELPQVKAALEKMNRLVSASITYLRGEQSFVVNGDGISEWVSIGDDFEVYLDNPQIKEYVRILATFYDTVGTKRNFITSKGEAITVGGGNYGWKVNQKVETEALTDAILTGQTVVKEPAYSRIAAVHGNGCDIYNTYVEISLASQHLWFYKDGALVVESSVVTGNPFAGNATPPGVFFLNYKAKDAILRGEDYETPVSYWMPFNGGIGLHDATWRGAFGGSIYRGGGSHGCVNLPFNVAKKIYENISRNDPVVVY